jgi:large subunit ribosomal protein L22
MGIQAKLMYLHIAPRKVRLIADLIRGKGVEKARIILNFADKRASEPMLKLLNSAAANAKNNFQIEDTANLYISKILVNEGPKPKRWLPASRGRANEIRKRTSHIILELSEIEKKATPAGVALSQQAKGLAEKKAEQKPEKVEKVEAVEAEEEKKTPLKVKERTIKPKFEKRKPKREAGLKRIFRRKAF